MSLERVVERVLFASRWLLAPLYLGLGLLLAVGVIHFYRELWHLAAHAWALSDVEFVLGSLGLIDLTLVAGLVVMVMLSGYENFVSRLTLAEAEPSIAWLGKLDAGSLKLKVAASIVAISAIELLKTYMAADTVPNDKLMWMALVHLALVASALMLAVMDRLVGHKDE